MIIKLLFTTFTLGFSVSLFAGEIYHCENLDGEKSFQDKPCEAIVLKVDNYTSETPIKKSSSSTDFYGISVHPTAMKKEVSDIPSIAVASLRYISSVSSSNMLTYYKANITEEYKESSYGDTTTLTYKVDGKIKAIYVMDVFGMADVTIQSEK
ncbi:hypothetical protein WNY51_03735 [Pseudocolwellia sp. AS88]|uniref:hypothetical protein n=1 Tax=Pseudocolwellia sp. AS88 TaxID=3063958 RepID=UPI0026F2EF51|nr:hypothetical protein [Pseudocolwellia sp. AS88]MDO7086828.1 hypothetical protein [Pseudocolwellia sp. AS88]